MLATFDRLLRLLSLLQMRSAWTGRELADELGVTTRTVRKDVGRLRDLGYPIHGSAGVDGGYRLGAGTSLPPLLLDDKEAVAVAVGLRAAADRGVTGIEEASVRALTKLEHVLPARLRPRVKAVQGAMMAVAGGEPGVAAEVLSALAHAIHDRERARFEVGGSDGDQSLTVEPHRLVHASGRWYLVAWDAEAGDWDMLRVDQVRPPVRRGSRFKARSDPEGDLTGFVQRRLGTEFWQYRARVTLHAPAERVIARVPPAVVVEPVDAKTCIANVGSDSAHELAFWVGMIDEDFELDPQSELATEVRKLARRYAKAAD
jgi:predicted DNA-binding transcriptional regulator YafY